ncbi:hypothetical protein AAVH_41478, partial [Aphelenchoides avenae]
CNDVPRPAAPPPAGPRPSIKDGTWHGREFCLGGAVARENCMCSCAGCIGDPMVCWAGEVCLHKAVSKRNRYGTIVEDHAAQCVGADQV